MQLKNRMNGLRNQAEKLKKEITAIQTGLDSTKEKPDRNLIHKLDELMLQYESIQYQIESMESRTMNLIAKSNLGKRFQERTFDTFDASVFPDGYEKAREYAETFRENNGAGLMFVGSVGTGKTHLAAAIVNYILAEIVVPVRFITAVELFGMLRDFEKNTETIWEFKDVPLLVIDDLGKEKVTEWNREKLFEIINYRYENYLPVIITTNGTPRELELKLGEAVFSRLCETCSGVMMNGKDYRR